MLRTAKIPYDEPVSAGDGTVGIKVYYGDQGFPTFYFNQKNGNLEEVLSGDALSIVLRVRILHLLHS